MEELDRISIQTTSSEGQSLQTVINPTNVNLITQVADVPQIQSILQDNTAILSSVVNAPFVEVTSVNGRTGDVITEPMLEDFAPNTYYRKNTLVSYGGSLYFANDNFTSGSSFDGDDWTEVSSQGITSWDDIPDKPNFATVAVSGSYNDLSNKPNLATVATSGSYNDLSNKPTIPAAQVQSDWTQTTTTAVDYIKNKPNLATVATSGAYNDLSGKPSVATTTSTGFVQVGDGLSITNAGVLSTELEIDDGSTISTVVPTISTSQIVDGAITTDKVDWSSIGNLTTGGLKIVTYTYSRSIVVGDNQFGVNASSSIPSGFTAVGLVGLDMSGSGYTRVIVNKNFISSTNYISISCFSNYDNPSIMTFTWYILCIKSV